MKDTVKLVLNEIDAVNKISKTQCMALGFQKNSK